MAITFVIVLLIVIFALILLVASFVFWLLMLIDCLRRKNFSDKLVWVLVIIFLHLFGAVLYYLIVKRADKTASKKR